MYGLSVQDRDGGKVHLEAAVDEWYGRTFAALGDSIVWAGGPLLNRVRARLGFASFRNLGVSGRPMADGTTAGAGTVTTALANSFTADAMVYIAAGTNDFRLDVPLGGIGTLTQTSHARSTFFGAYRTVIDYLLAQNPGVQIVLATPLQRNNAGYTTTSTNGAGHMLRDYRSAIFALGDMYSLPVVDLYALSGISEKTLDRYTLDGLHPNEQGYVQMARVVVGQLRSGGTSASADGRIAALTYDSGPRNVSSLLANGWTGTAYLQRTGSDVQLRLEGVTAPSTGSTSPFTFMPGFMPRGAGLASRGLLFTTATNPVVRRFEVAATTGQLTIRNVTAGDVLYGEVTFKTTDPIPTTLPGSAA